MLRLYGTISLGDLITELEPVRFCLDYQESSLHRIGMGA